MSALYLESSALLRFVLNEPGASEVEERIDRAEETVASRLVGMEADRALIRHGIDHPQEAHLMPEFNRRLREACSEMTFLEITREVCALAGRIAASHRLRSLDAIHLATYEILRRVDPAAEILTFDERLRAAL